MGLQLALGNSNQDTIVLVVCIAQYTLPAVSCLVHNEKSYRAVYAAETCDRYVASTVNFTASTVQYNIIRSCLR